MSPEISAAKAALRAKVRSARVGRSGHSWLSPLLPQLEQVGVIAGYIGYGDEPSVTEVLQWALSQGKEVLLPLLRADMDLDWGQWNGEELVERGKLLEPQTGSLEEVSRADVLLVPALAVDRLGFRLGQGGGSYDRVLARLSTPCIAVVYDDEVMENVPHEAFDQKVSHAATPTRLITF